MKKPLTTILFVLLAFASRAQTVKEQFYKVDTVPGHGYEIMFIGSPVTKKVYTKTDAGVKATLQTFYRPGDYTWDQAKVKIDSVFRSNGNWSLPTVSQLQTIITLTQAILDKQRIRLGSLDYEGLLGAFWCCNQTKNGQINIDSIYNAGLVDGQHFAKTESNAKRSDGTRLVDDDNPGNVSGTGGKITDHLIFIRKY